jgi:transposase InsO family protein
MTRDFTRTVLHRLAAVYIELYGVLSDNGPEFIGRTFTSELADLGISHNRLP